MKSVSVRFKKRVIIVTAAALVVFLPAALHAGEEEDFMNTFAAVMNQLSSDIKSSHYRIVVESSESAKTLTLYKFLVNESTGVPEVDRKGYPKEGFPIKYTYNPIDKTLVRESLKTKQPICSLFHDVQFAIEPYEIATRAGNKTFQVPAVKTTIVFEEEGELVSLERLIIPRFTACWAKQPTWVINSQGACLRFPDYEVK